MPVDDDQPVDADPEEVAARQASRGVHPSAS
jgi:hypothetical protein